MTREELIKNLEYTMKKHENDRVDTFSTNISLMCKDMLDYLEQEPCPDAISRQAVKAYKYHRTMYPNFEDYVDMLPPVTPQPKTGYWIKSRDCYGNYHFTCSECGNDIATQYADNWEDKYCSECGCRMVESQTESEEENGSTN